VPKLPGSFSKLLAAFFTLNAPSCGWSLPLRGTPTDQPICCGLQASATCVPRSVHLPEVLLLWLAC
jgi:hypothetical protein